MICTLKSGVGHATLLFKGLWLAAAVWLAGGVVAHARDTFQERHAESILSDQVAPAEEQSLRQRVSSWAAEFPKVVRVKTATTILLYVLGVVLATELSQASCMAGHTVACKMAQSLVGGGN